MKGNKSGAMPRFDSLDELISFFDENDMGEFDEQMAPVKFEVDIKRRKWLISIDEGVATKLGEIARQRQMSSEALANAWLMEKIEEEPGRIREGHDRDLCCGRTIARKPA